MENAKPKVGVASNGEPMHYSVGAFVQDELGRYLLFERKFPPLGLASAAGHVDEGEDDPSAVMRREGFEELGTEFTELEFLCEEELLDNACWKAPHHYWYLFRAKVRAADVLVDDHEAGKPRWCYANEIPMEALEPAWQHWFTKCGIIGTRA